ncbi:MAG TPA: ABC transporter permease subunit [Verrucomicrobiae bacterium]|jgi:ABC-2 type transport system permease protein|nr:ABC transporter permease subunit [Verrucomicrobiae bacterium]
MQAYLTLTRRELGSLFVSITGYIIIAGAVFLLGLSFVDLLDLLQGEATPAPVTQLFYSTGYFWEILLLAAPVITMRLFALEKSSGTFETLMTTPVSDLQVVLAKFSAAMVFYMLMWLPSLLCILILRHYVSRTDVFDPGLIASTFLGILLLGGLFMSLGCFASSLTGSQIVAAMISFVLGYTLFLLSYLPGHLPLASGWQAALVAHVALFDHMNDFARGVVDTRHVVFYVTVTGLFLFLTLRVVESRRWK